MNVHNRRATDEHGKSEYWRKEAKRWNGDYKRVSEELASLKGWLCWAWPATLIIAYIIGVNVGAR